jgi:hypothetical protein
MGFKMRRQARAFNVSTLNATKIGGGDESLCSLPELYLKGG